MTNPKVGEVIAIGDEMIGGARLDTNTQWLAQRLNELGVQVAYHTTVGDDLHKQAEVFRIAFGRADIVVVTGGLGPTADDLTRFVLEKVCERPLALIPECLLHIQSLFKRYGREMPESNRIQAMLPIDSQPIANPQGTAPGIDLEHFSGAKKIRVFCLPGVPAEMKEMWHQHVADQITNMLDQKLFVADRVINTFGAGESHVEQLLGDLIARDRNPLVGITASESIISLRVLARNASYEKAVSDVNSVEAFIRERLGELVFGIEDQSLPKVFVDTLIDRDETICLVDLGLNGDVASALIHALPPNLHGENANDRVVSGICGGVSTLLSWGILESAANWFQDPDLKSEQIQSIDAVLSEIQRRSIAQWNCLIGPIQLVDGEESAGNVQQFIFAFKYCDKPAYVQWLRHYGHTSFRHSRSVKQVINCLRLESLKSEQRNNRI